MEIGRAIIFDINADLQNGELALIHLSADHAMLSSTRHRMMNFRYEPNVATSVGDDLGRSLNLPAPSIGVS